MLLSSLEICCNTSHNLVYVFDLVTACEVLYYMTDLDRACERLTRLARNCVVTYHRGAFAQLDNYFAGKQVKSETIRGAACEWRVVYWVGRGM